MSDTYRDQNDPDERIALLTEREREVLRLAARLGTSKRIAAELRIEPASVDTTLYRATSKLGIKGRAAAAALLVRHEEAASRNLDSAPPDPAPSRTCPVVETDAYPLPDERDEVGTALFEVGLPFQAEHPSIGATLRRLLFEPGERHDLTNAQRLRAIAYWAAGGVLLLCLLGIILGELSRIAASLLPHHRL